VNLLGDEPYEEFIELPTGTAWALDAFSRLYLLQGPSTWTSTYSGYDLLLLYDYARTKILPTSKAPLVLYYWDLRPDNILVYANGSLAA